MMAGDDAAVNLPASLAAARVLLIGTGAMSVTQLPVLAQLLVTRYRVEVAVALTAAATRLVSVEALSAVTRRPVLGPSWPAGPVHGAEHVYWADWADVIAVWPATLHFLARCAVGFSSDLPTAIVTSAVRPVVFAPSLAPAAVHGGPYRRVRDLLIGDGHVMVGPVSGPSITHRTDSLGACAPLTALLDAIAVAGRERTLAGTTQTPHPGGQHG